MRRSADGTGDSTGLDIWLWCLVEGHVPYGSWLMHQAKIVISWFIDPLEGRVCWYRCEYSTYVQMKGIAQ